MKHRPVRFTIPAAVAGLLAVSAAGAAERPSLEPRAEQLLRSVAAFYGGLTGVSVKAELHILMEAEGRKGEMDSTLEFAMQRPNRFALTMRERAGSMKLLSDGTLLYVLPGQGRQYLTNAAPARLEDFFHEEVRGFDGAAGYALLNVLLAKDPYAELTAGVQTGRYLRQSEDGSHHLQFSQRDLDWELWVQDGPQPWVNRVVIDLSKAFRIRGGPRRDAADARMVTTLRYSDWTAHPPAEAFVFQPPPGSRAVASLEAPEREPHSTLGKPAPPLKLALLDGGELDLTEHKGKRVVVLDFWATWCGPCRRSLPALGELAEQYKDREIRFYAVNQMEDADRVRKFISSTGLKLPVPLDRDGEVSRSYGIEAIPHTVLIGKDGSVQGVHVGYTPELKDTLRRQVDALLDGQNLVETER